MSSYAQRSIIKQAQAYYDRGDYQKVIESLIEIEDVQKYDKAVRMLGVSFTKRGQSALAIPLIQSYLSDIPEDPMMIRTLAEAEFLSGDFETAAETYKSYLRIGDVDERELQSIMLRLLHCQSAVRYTYLDQNGYAENLGNIVNSKGDEILPVASHNHNDRYYFSSNRVGAVGGLRSDDGLKDEKFGRYYHDMYRLDVDNGGYASVSPIAPLVNSSAHDYVSDFTSDGKVLIFIKDRGKRGAELLTDTFMVDRPLDYYPQSVTLPVVPEAGDRDIQLVHDTIMIFSSARKGGYGGYDLWITSKNDSTWSEPTNLGPTINSPFDELGAYMTSDGLQLYYSSNRPASIGGLDIFKQQFSLESRSWTAAENLIAPFNSPADEHGFTLSQDGSKAIISSNRDGGYGGFDLYYIYLKEPVQSYGSDVFVLSQMLTPLVPVSEDTISTILPTVDESKEVLLPTREIVMSPQQYSGTAGLSDPKVKKALSTISDAIKVYPGTRVLISSKVPALGNYSREVFFALKQGEEIVEDLLDQGSPAASVFVEGLPSSDIEYSFSPSLLPASPALEALHIDPAHASINGLTFRVLYREVTQMLQDENLADFDCSMIKSPDSEAYKIFTLPVRSYEEASKVRLSLLRAEPSSVALITPFMNGMPMSMQEVEKLATSMPELQYYLADK